MAYLGVARGAGAGPGRRPERVVVTVRPWSSATSCSDVGVTYTVSGRLSSHVGARPVVDGACEILEYQRYENCQQP